MAELSDQARQVRQLIMDQILREGTAPASEDVRQRLSLSAEAMSQILADLDAALCFAVQRASHVGLTHFQEEPVQGPLPPVGDVFYPHPFANFKNHYPVTVDGEQKWYAECAVEGCAISTMFPGREVILRSEGVGELLGDFAGIGWLDIRSRPEALEWELDRPNIAPALAVLRPVLVVLTQPAAPPLPGNTPFHYPPAREQHKAALLARLADHLELDAVLAARFVMHLAGVVLIPPDQLERRPALVPRPEDPAGARAIILIRRPHQHQQQMPLGVHQIVPLASGYLFFPHPSPAPRRPRSSSRSGCR